MNTTLEISGAKLTVPTEDLFRAWMRERVAIPAAPTNDHPQSILHPPMLDDGEVYLGAFVSADGKHQHHTILLPFDRDDMPWDKHMAWAHGEGFDLPNRLELLMMWLTMRSRFQETWYWSNEAHHEDTAYAWYQDFGYGYQGYHRKSAALRAVAVRRSPIQSFINS
ncbi:MAG: DUF1566 domain-containing protein [Betaproteobacteria bacterium]|nr:DUF1566 domain-containing protein [Betaproteobacteria bacterium]